ncbi:hypothetical protein EAH87_01790 [Sphingomonas koreensis]|nr:hypothetical protein EAH87_01790 [Sphingomonas koreensis]
MICLVALAAAQDRRHAAMALWFGAAIALSGWAALAAPALIAIGGLRRAPLSSAAIALLTAAGTTLALAACGVAHAFAPAAAWAIGGAGLAILAYAMRHAGPPAILARAIQRIG